MIVRRRGAQGSPGVYMPVDRADYFGRFLNIPGVSAMPSPGGYSRMRGRGLSAAPAFGATAANLLRNVPCPDTMPYQTITGCSRFPGAAPPAFAPMAPVVDISRPPAPANVVRRRIQPMPMIRPPAGVFQFHRARNSGPGRLRLGMRGVGLGDCPDFAPYEVNGACSNIPPGVDAHEFFTGGGEASEAGVVAPLAPQPGFVQTPYTGGDVPPGYFMNTVTGRVEQLSPAQIASMARGSATAERDRANAEIEAREAERLGRSKGLDVSCTVQENCGMVADGNGNVIPGARDCLYWSDCNVNGSTGHEAGLLMRPGGFEIAVTEIARAAGAPLTSAPVLPNPQAVPFVERVPRPMPPELPPNAPPIPAELQPQPRAATSGGAAPSGYAGSRPPAPAAAPPGGPLPPGEYSDILMDGPPASDGFLSRLMSGSLSLFGFDVPYWALALGGGALLLKGRR